MMDILEDWEYLCQFNDTDCSDLGLETPSPLGPRQVSALVCYGLVFLLGVPGNGLVVWVTGFRMPHSVNSLWFLQLALADLLCCLSMPLLMVPLAQDQHWTFGLLACKVLSGLLYFTMYCSMLLLVLISLDRWLLVSRPVWCQNWRRLGWARGVCAGVWLLALISSTPHFVFATEHLHGQKVICSAGYGPETAWIVTILRFSLGFLLPVLIIGMCHWVVYNKAAHRTSQGGVARSQRMRRIICAVVLCFVACWLPLHIIDILVLMEPRDSPNLPHLRLAEALTLCLAYFNSCLNPLLYVCLGRGFKDSLARSLRSVFSFLPEEPSHQQHRSLTLTQSQTKSTTEILEKGM
ncbi:C5a anaphylatoxin chemotactic receptor 1 [Brienomyrus brachyistius]|uniref:C5a anaphylatoxin chemotactic receptor 1 n=1 Tax=Brienomyrus brachyistius TaxID=42636 RepID=UPI0020B3AA9A|nr:C5a anaphylatoxin chemotactic receptor 1 [Brienomyrus brachyistius]